MTYKGFTVAYDYIDANRVYRVDTDRTTHRFHNLYWALQFCKTVWLQLSNSKQYNYES